ncbi:MAG: SAM-dependent methyltransferase [Myxococcota bacterium]
MDVRALIYDTAILPLTSKWYRRVLDFVPPGASMLDVGIGTGSALMRNARVVKAKRLDVVGVDIDADYVKRCQKHIWKEGLGRHVRVFLQSVYDHDGGPYDAVYFSASFMLLPDPAAALHHVSTLLRPGGSIYFTQTFEERRSPVMEQIKPILGQLTTIEFGRVTYEADFRSIVEAGGVDLLEMEEIGRSGRRTYRLAVGRPRTA